MLVQAELKFMREIAIELPLRIVSVANTREHWASRAKRAREQRALVRMALSTQGLQTYQAVTSWTVELTRIAPRELDGDNLQSACKAVRDGVADFLRVDDGDKRVTWVYRCEPRNPREYALGIYIEARV